MRHDDLGQSELTHGVVDQALFHYVEGRLNGKPFPRGE
ncbi:hypothetical protein J2X04_000885 [Lysobacter niabensis]|uniref:Uncharacterized protein n=1 Tax=Agrilutibacter niabensis TaxID=380628 RepID=A0ABU1VM34_9GAMM|nr:hypothetical protein [Lysobacter niabensis]